jgi:SAM-dependent methyltransferase
MMGLDSYRKLSQEVYDLSKPEPADFVWEFYLNHAQSVEGPILEPMCGSGRFLVPLLEQGFDIDGVDASPDMLRACRQRCAAKGFRPALYQQFLYELGLPRRYALAVIPAASFGLVTEDEEIQDSLQGIYHALLPGGRFVLEIETLASIPEEFGQWHGYWHERPDGAIIVTSNLARSFDEERNILHTIVKYELVKDGRPLETEFETLRTRLYKPTAFTDLLTRAGFVDVKFHKSWGEYTDRPPDEGDPQVAFECYRR